MDVAGAVSVLIIASPAMAAVAVVIAVRMGRPVFFSQARPGKDAKIFMLWKFRTMLNVDATKRLVEDGERLTALGRFLRATSLDELPTMINVLRGDMSFVGPRPLLVQYLDKYTPRQARRHEVRPGVTGLAQCKGRNALSWEEKFEWDISYVENRSLILDARILLWTFASVVRREGISANDHATMPEFEGSQLTVRGEEE
ncbi:sugar transferase [Arthrobacter sp. RT-1]|nr:sugar transferase [Arthrobacter sp. RT-1]